MTAPPSLLDYLEEPDLDRFAEAVADLLLAGARRIAPPTESAATATATTGAEPAAAPAEPAPPGAGKPKAADL